MKILVVVPSITSYPFLRDLCLALVERGSEVHFATFWTSEASFERDKNKIAFHLINFPRGMNPVAHVRAARELNDIVHSVQPDAVDVHFSAAAFTAAVAKKSNWPPVLATIQGLRFPLARGGGAVLLKWAECWSASRLSKFIVLTKDDLAALQRAGVANCYQQKAYGFGCDLEKFHKDRHTEKILRSEQKINKQPGEVVFAFVGRLVDFKGFHLVVRSFLEISKTQKNVKLIICGDYDKYHASGLTDAEMELAIQHEKIIFLGWTNSVEDYLCVTDSIVFPSEREGVPVNLMEALSMGVPVITCDSRGCREVMDEGRNGIIIESRTVEALTEAMLNMSVDESQREKYSLAALSFREKFDRAHFVREHISLIDELV